MSFQHHHLLQHIHTHENTPALKEEFFNGILFQSTLLHTSSLKDLLKDITAKDFDIAIKLAVNAIQSMNQSAKTIQYKEALAMEIKKQVDAHEALVQQLQKKESAERESLKSNHETRKLELETEIRNLKATLSVNDVTIQRLREQLSNSEGFFRSTLDDIVKKKEQQYEKELERLSLQHKSVLMMMEESSRERIESLRTVYKENEDKLRKQLEKSLVSSEKGKQGEKEIDELVAQYTSWGPLQNTSKTSHATDRSGRIKHCDVLFEVKNYTSEVPSSEVEKFERDMEEHHNIPFGVFISMKTGICGKKSDGFLTTKWTPRSQLLLFINHFYSHNVEDVLKFIEISSELALTVYKGVRDVPPDSEMCLALQGRIEQAKIFVEKEIQRMKQFLTTLEHDKKFLITTIQKHNATYVYNIQQSAEALKLMLQALLGSDTGVKEEDDGLKTPPGLDNVSSSNAAGSNGGGQEDITIVPDDAVRKPKRQRGGASKKK